MLAFYACIFEGSAPCFAHELKAAENLERIFAEPTSAGIEWMAIEGLLIAVGCEIVEGRGSRVRFVKDGLVETFHRPHPDKEAKRYQVRDARDFLIRLGVKI